MSSKRSSSSPRSAGEFVAGGAVSMPSSISAELLSLGGSQEGSVFPGASSLMTRFSSSFTGLCLISFGGSRSRQSSWLFVVELLSIIVAIDPSSSFLILMTGLSLRLIFFFALPVIFKLGAVLKPVIRDGRGKTSPPGWSMLDES